MTMIANYPTKKAFKEAVEKNASSIWITDPALMPEWRHYGERFILTALPIGAHITVTNHPKRSWFAEVWIDQTATLKVR